MNKTKVCKKCGEEKDITLFVKSKNCKDGYENKCKECKNKENRENKEKIKEYRKRHMKKNKEKIKEQKRRYYKENKERISEKNKRYYKENKEEINKHNKQYYKENPHIFFNASNKRRSKEEQQGKGINKEQWLDMMKFFDWKCAYSGEELIKNKNRSIDHIFCLDNGGLNEIWNVVPMIKNYNASKKAQNPMEWYLKQDFYSEDRLNKIIQWQIYSYKKYATEDDEKLILIVDII